MQDLDKINPLNVFDCREVVDPPPYFHYIYADVRGSNIEHIRQWIHENLNHRFYIGESLQLENNEWSVKIKLGFEEPKEASFFLLACSLLKPS